MENAETMAKRDAEFLTIYFRIKKENSITIMVR